jgi:hypothetical protein
VKIKSVLAYFWKLPLCGIAFFVGMALSGALLSALGLQSPQIPIGTDANIIALYFLLGSMILALGLSMLSQKITANGFLRWSILSSLTWMVAAVGMVLESTFFMQTGAVDSTASALYTIVHFLLPSIFLSGMVAILFRPVKVKKQTRPSLSVPEWAWKLLLALLAYPLIYFTFGLLVQPFVMEYYALGQYELVVPSWGQLIPLQLSRSALFLLVCLPLVRFWQGSRRALWLSLGFSFFLLTAFMAVITAYWFPWQMRLFHGLELLADGMLYVGVLVWLFVPAEREQPSQVYEMERKEPEYV